MGNLGLNRGVPGPGQGYGKGNLGMEGITKFLSCHQCNEICKFLVRAKRT